jgi:hypothetical protein
LNNALYLLADTLDPIGVCFDPTVAMINHSCEPNALVAMDGARLSIRSTENIRKGEEITMAYVSPFPSRYQRQRTLLDQYYFECKCPLCEAQRLSPNDCWLQPTTSLSEAWAMAADGYAKQVSHGLDGRPDDLPARRLHVLATVASSHADVEANANVANVFPPVPALATAWNNALRICALSKMWPIDKYPWPNARQKMILHSLDQEDFPTAFTFDANGYFFVNPKLFPNPAHPLRLIQTWRLAKLALALGYGSDGEAGSIIGVKSLHSVGIDMTAFVFGLIRECSDNVDKSHGADSKFASEVHGQFTTMRAAVARAGSGSSLAAMTSALDGCLGRMRRLTAFLEIKYCKSIDEEAKPLGKTVHPDVFAPLKFDEKFMAETEALYGKFRIGRKG